MSGLIFGSRERPLFGVHHEPPPSDQAPAPGILMAYPFGEEYLRGHRFLRRVAIDLCARGRHVFRFDFGGTGDSAGASETVSLSSMVSDLRLAADEFKDLSGLSSFEVLAVRISAIPALTFAEADPAVSHLYLLDPVSSTSEMSPRFGADGFTVGPAFEEEVTRFPSAPSLAASLQTGCPVSVARSGEGFPGDVVIADHPLAWVDDDQSAVIIAPKARTRVVDFVTQSEGSSLAG